MSINELATLLSATTHNDLRRAARESALVFVRSQDHLSLYSSGAVGRTLTANEVLDAYGRAVLEQVYGHGSAVLAYSAEEPSSTFSKRRLALGLTVADVAKATKLSANIICEAENPAKRNKIRDLERLAIALGLDERLISAQHGAGGDERLAVRLKDLGGKSKMTPAFVTSLAEASWVIRAHSHLQELLEVKAQDLKHFEPRELFTSGSYPPWQQGYDLAAETRRALDIGEREPIPSMRDVCARLEIPLLQTKLPLRCAGATVVSGGKRGIVINTEGYNSNVWVRRATIAHELGHVLWDVDHQLDRVVVDNYRDVESLGSSGKDRQESRANAFAIAFLAPGEGVQEEYQTHEPGVGLRGVMERFGISLSAAKHHIENVTNNTITASLVDTEPSDEWVAREGFTDLYFPIAETPAMRRGEFAGLVVSAQEQGLISMDTAASYMGTSQAEFEKHRNSIASIFQ